MFPINRLLPTRIGSGDPVSYTHLDVYKRQIEANSQVESISVLMSGDTGFYSGARNLLPLLEGYEVDLIPGISSVQYFASRLRRPWQDWKLVSAHGKSCDAASLVRDNAETFFLTGGLLTVQVRCV